MRSASHKILASEKEIKGPPKKALTPSEIGYYGRPITELKKNELTSALIELAKMYKDSKSKLKNIG